MPTFDVDVAEQELEDLVERAISGEEILIRDGETIVKLEPFSTEDRAFAE
jgi:antitoxin (DNA-binding transcriptional repressor) of toxin-antitoxin stability system